MSRPADDTAPGVRAFALQTSGHSTNARALALHVLEAREQGVFEGGEEARRPGAPPATSRGQPELADHAALHELAREAPSHQSGLPSVRPWSHFAEALSATSFARSAEQRAHELQRLLGLAGRAA